jgi:predicted tellurium resistance membrane protein TerC
MNFQKSFHVTAFSQHPVQNPIPPPIPAKTILTLPALTRAIRYPLHLPPLRSKSINIPANTSLLENFNMLPDTLFLTLADAAATLPAQADAAPVALISWASLISLITLASLEIVLGIDNVIFIAILSGKLPVHQRVKAQRVGIGLAVFMRIGLLLSIFWLMKLTAPLITYEPWSVSVSGKDLIMLIGGLFLIGKATWELHEKLEAEDHSAPHHQQAAQLDSNTPAGPNAPSTSVAAAKAVGATFASVIVQILLIDIVFSLDSVITAVGMAQQIPVMIAAVIIASGVMMIFAKPVSDFVEKHPTMKVLALSFLILIGTMLVADGFGKHIPKGYIYFAMAFSLAVEFVNMKVRAKPAAPIRLNNSTLPSNPPNA